MMSAPILIDIPSEFESERLLIRAPRPGDGAAIDEAVRETLVPLRQWMEWALPEPSVEISEAFARRGAADYIARTSFPMLLWLKDGTTLVGSSGFRVHDWLVPSFEIGYWCRARFEGQGYITEAVRAISRFIFEEFDARRIEIRCDARNERSARVAQRVGYQLEGRFHNHRIDTSGQLQDSLVFAVVSQEQIVASSSSIGGDRT
jgi:RimJ/RimL family protein N-acetyltransferase